ncbi:MAG: hypothetical protein KKB50_01045 [Planctomycetes bacterium]|nr:hypothetical protein [Planctomycetota bacterium]
MAPAADDIPATDLEPSEAQSESTAEVEAAEPSPADADGGRTAIARIGGAVPKTKPTAGMQDRIGPMVTEIRARMAEIASRELAIERREHSLKQQYRRLEQAAKHAARQELEEARRRLEVRSAELDAQAIELATQRATLEEAEETLARREREQEQTERHTSRLDDRLRRHGETERQKRKRDRRALLDRIAVVRQREHDLQQRIRAARDDISERRDNLKEDQAELERQAAELEQRREEIEARTAEWDKHLGELQARAAAVEAQEARQKGGQAQTEELRRQLSHSLETLEEERVRAIEKQRQLDREWRAMRAKRNQLAKSGENADVQRRDLKQELAALEERAQRLDNREQQLADKAAEVEREAGRLRKVELELTERQRAIDALYQQAVEFEQDMQRGLEDTLALREQVEARDAEVRQTTLALEVEQQELRRKSELLDHTREEFAEQRGRHESKLRGARELLARQASLARSAPPPAPRPGWWWLRAGCLSVVAAAAAAVGWLALDLPRYRGMAEIRIISESRAAERVVAEHAARLLMPGFVSEEHIDADLAAAWWRAVHAGRVVVTPLVDQASVEVRVTAEIAGLGRRLVESVAESYARHVNRSVARHELPVGFADLIERQASVKAELDELRAQQLDAVTALAGIPETAELERHVAELEQARRDYAEIGQKLAQAREELDTLKGAEVPRGTVTPEEYEQALAADQVYSEDQKEYRSQTRSYQRELAVGMVMVVDPLKVLRRSLATLRETIAEQRALEPPAEIGSVLEACATGAERLERPLAAFLQQWNKWREEVENADLGQDVLELVKRQSTAAESLRRICDEVRTLLTEMQTQIAGVVAASSGGTREVVVAAVLRSDLATLGTSIEALSEVGGAVDPTQNFRLDAPDRQLRGLRTRLNSRRAAVRQQAQLAADQRAREQHEAQLTELRTSVREAEQRREQAILSLAEQMDRLRTLEVQVHRRRTLEAAVQSNDTQAARLEAQLKRLDGGLAEGRRATSKPDRAEVVSVREEQIAGTNRHTRAAATGAGAFVVTWLVCLLMIVGGSARRRPGSLGGEQAESGAHTDQDGA